MIMPIDKSKRKRITKAHLTDASSTPLDHQERRASPFVYTEQMATVALLMEMRDELKAIRKLLDK